MPKICFSPLCQISTWNALAIRHDLYEIVMCSTFVVTKSCPQVIKKENLFDVKVFLLVAPALRLQEPVNVTASFVRFIFITNFSSSQHLHFLHFYFPSLYHMQFSILHTLALFFFFPAISKIKRTLPRLISPPKSSFSDYSQADISFDVIFHNYIAIFLYYLSNIGN